MELLTYLLLFALGALVGYVLRKYVEKRWPDEAALLDRVATKYGQEAERRLREYRKS